MHKKKIRQAGLIISSLLWASHSAWAETSIKRLSVPQPKTEQTSPVQAPTEVKKERHQPKDFYLPYDESISSPNIRLILPSDSDEVFVNKINAYDNNLATISPTVLYMAASSLADRGLLQKAAIYYTYAELRQEFDKKRFTVDNQSAGYRTQILMKKTAFYKVSPWITKSADKMRATYEKVKYLDLTTPAHYHPGYNIKDQAEQEEWPHLHDNIRAQFFKNSDKYLKPSEEYKKP